MIGGVAHQTPPTPIDPEVTLTALNRALEALDQAWSDHAAAVAAVDPPQQAFELATQIGVVFTDRMRSAASDAADLRTRMVARIWKAEELSLAHLARRIGVSKARADQMTRAAKAAEQRKD